MGMRVVYADLPGGPTFVRLADEISRYSLCAKCGMLSLSLYHDPAGHVFCKTCLVEQCTKQRRLYFYCSQESKVVALNEMIKAHHLNAALGALYVDCPNKPDCQMKMRLDELNDHYLPCKPRYECPTCCRSVETKNWREHVCVFESSLSGTWTTVSGAFNFFFLLLYALCLSSYLFLNSLSSVKHPITLRIIYVDVITLMVVFVHFCNFMYPTAFRKPLHNLGQHKKVNKTAKRTASLYQRRRCANISTCRRVKDNNMPRHLRNCTKAPEPCVYCEAPFRPRDMTSHIQNCFMNPDNATKVSSSQCKSGAAVPNPLESDSSDSSHADQYPPGDGPIWLQYLASGDWLGAFMTMEESSNFRKLEEHDRHARLASTLVYLEQHACVRDFLKQPSLVQPFDSLLAALFVRAYYLPRNVWSKREEVTWERALACLPKSLASRLGGEAVHYLHAFPVFLDEKSAQGVAANKVRPARSQPRPNPESDSMSEPTASGTSGEASEREKETEMETSEPDLAPCRKPKERKPFCERLPPGTTGPPLPSRMPSDTSSTWNENVYDDVEVPGYRKSYLYLRDKDGFADISYETVPELDNVEMTTSRGDKEHGVSPGAKDSAAADGAKPKAVADSTKPASEEEHIYEDIDELHAN
ncbi:hypothetical protein HPB52_012477 [Rhipicephalus sanguineus]|uniref:Uncharacterized protein n=1 Tax=Rhipicephalus sanguineus TaxID=34632 RepID=A0A9D4T0N0_RHISA|nr:hypothetical protein HPB52_012477 [Rhipicephalus sanguineus]